jgi:hypothetical protein
LLKHTEVVALVDVTLGLQYPIQYPLSYQEVRWKRQTALPQLTQPDPGGEAVYRRDLEGQPVRLAVSAALRFLRVRDRITRVM